MSEIGRKMPMKTVKTFLGRKMKSMMFSFLQAKKTRRKKRRRDSNWKTKITKMKVKIRSSKDLKMNQTAKKTIIVQNRKKKRHKSLSLNPKKC
jgi:hypothetical protein